MFVFRKKLENKPLLETPGNLIVVGNRLTKICPHVPRGFSKTRSGCVLRKSHDYVSLFTPPKGV